MESNDARIGPSSYVNGRIEGDGNLIVEGRVDGSIQIRGDLHIEASASVKSSVSARNILVFGLLVGDAVAAERIELAPSGRMIGDVRTPRFTVHEGAAFKGRVDMVDFPGPERPLADPRTAARGQSTAYSSVPYGSTPFAGSSLYYNASGNASSTSTGFAGSSTLYGGRTTGGLARASLPMSGMPSTSLPLSSVPLAGMSTPFRRTQTLSNEPARELPTGRPAAPGSSSAAGQASAGSSTGTRAAAPTSISSPLPGREASTSTPLAQTSSERSQAVRGQGGAVYQPPPLPRPPEYAGAKKAIVIKKKSGDT